MKCGNSYLCSKEIEPDNVDQEYCEQQCRVDVTGANMCQNPNCKKLYYPDDEEETHGFWSWEFCSMKCLTEIKGE